MLLSIILPVYNVEKYISHCLESLMRQDMSKNEYEVICVNDGSTDNSLQVLKAYARKYSNIKVCDKINQGVSIARNTGMSFAKGNYIWFVDPDDFVDANCIGGLINALKKSDADYLVMDYDSCTEKAKFIEREKQVYNIYINKKRTPRASGWVYIVKKELLLKNNISFEEKLTYGEDYLWALLVWLYGEKYLVVENNIYHYRNRSNSAMSTRTTEQMKKHVEGMLNLADIYSELLVKENWNKEKYHEIARRIPECSQVVLWDLALNKFSEEYNIKIFNQLKEKGYYPYKIKWSSLIPKGNYKQVIMDYLAVFFPCEMYYKMLKRVIGKIGRRV